jgi:hypothetical protein
MYTDRRPIRFKSGPKKNYLSRPKMIMSSSSAMRWLWRARFCFRYVIYRFEVERRHDRPMARYRLVLFNHLIAHNGANEERAIYPVTAITKPAGMPDRGPQVSQARSHVSESGLKKFKTKPRMSPTGSSSRIWLQTPGLARMATGSVRSPATGRYTQRRAGRAGIRPPGRRADESHAASEGIHSPCSY